MKGVVEKEMSFWYLEISIGFNSLSYLTTTEFLDVSTILVDGI